MVLIVRNCSVSNSGFWGFDHRNYGILWILLSHALFINESTINTIFALKIKGNKIEERSPKSSQRNTAIQSSMNHQLISELTNQRIIKRMKKAIFAFLLLYSLQGYSQEMWGISNSNYSGNMGIFLNPSTIVGAPYKYEINFIAADFFAENTYIYFPQRYKIIPRTITNDVAPGKQYFFRTGGGLQQGYSHILIIGPSYIKNLGDHAWGLHSAFRTEASLTDIPTSLAYAFYGNFRTPDIFGIRTSAPKFSLAEATWIELGGTYGKVRFDTEKHYLKWAATGNLLIGMNGLYGDFRKTEYTILDTFNTVFHNVDATIGNAIDNDGLISFRGAGLSTTLGATYMKKHNSGGFECNRSNDKIKKYDYRIGVSLMDLGTIRYFRKSQVVNVMTTTDRLWTGIDSADFSAGGINPLIATNLTATVEDKGFYMWLPTALSAQFDYSFTSKIYGNLSVVKRIHFTANQIARADQVNLSGRYETRSFEGNVNFSLYEFKQPSMGIGLRYKFFVIGSDRLLQLIGLSDVQAFDFFFGFKWQFCKRPFSPGPDCAAYN